MNAIPAAGIRRDQPQPSRAGGWWRLLVALLAGVLMPALAQEYSTLNRDALNHFWTVAEQRTSPATVISFGDSMADSYRSVTFHLMNKLIGRFGASGCSLNNYANTALVNLTNNAFPVLGGEFWFSYYTGVPAGGAVWWENQASPAGVYCDEVGVFYVAQPSGGQFRFSLSTNGGPWTMVLLLDGFSSTPAGRFAKLSLSPNRYRLRIDSDAGTNYIIGPHTLSAHGGGVHVVFMDLGGISLGEVTNVSPAIREPILAALQPDLLVWHMKEDGSPGASDRMEACERWWTNSIPGCDVLYLGTPWFAADTNSTITPDQNLVVRNIALHHHRAYVDLMQPTLSYQWLATNAFMADAVHLNSNGGFYCANLLWNDLGLFALGLNREISLSSAGGQLHLTYATSVGAGYQLEVSTNWQTWSVIVTNPAGASGFSTNFVPDQPNMLFRLRLTPN